MSFQPIFDADENALPQLRDKLAILLQQREHIAHVNKLVRKAAKAGGDALSAEGLTEQERESLRVTHRVQSYYDPLHKGFPPYVSANLSGNISRIRARITRLEQQGGF